MRATTELPADALRKVFSYLDGVELLRARCVCRYWRSIGNDRILWRRVALRASSALTPDTQAWPLLLARVGRNTLGWRRGYMKLRERCTQMLRVEVYMYGISVFDIIAHRVRGPALSLASRLIVYRRFRAIALHSAVKNNASVFYLAPARFDADFLSYSTFARALARRDHAGLAAGGHACAVVPPGFFARKECNYYGDGLLLVVQDAFLVR